MPTAPAAWTTETLLDILNRQPQPVTRFNPQGRILFANAAYAQLFGQTPAKMIGRNIRDFIPRCEWANVRKHLASLTRARPNGLHENVVRTGKSADKSSRLLWFNTALFDIKGALIGFQSCAHNITELRNVERRLEHSYSLLYRIIDSIADPIFVKDSKRRMVLVNRAECALTGYPRDQVLGRTDDGFFPPKQVAEFRRRDLQVLRTGRPNVNEEQITDARGNVHTLITKKSLLKGPNGERMIVGVIRDVTDLKRTEKSLREREEQYRTLLANLAVGVFRSSLDGRIVQANNACARILGCRSVHALIGRSIKDFYLQRRLGASLIKDLRQGKQLRNIIIPLRRADGRTILVSFSGRGHLGDKKKPIWFEGVLDDVTRQHFAENQLRLLEFSIENAADAVVWADPQGRFIRVNRSACRLSGYTRSQLMELRVQDLDAENSPKQIRELWNALRRKGSLSWETTVRRRDGRLIPVEVHANYIRYGGAEFNCAFVRDISERRQIELERRRFATALMDVQENERREISQTLHDQLGQLLTLARIEVGSVPIRNAQTRDALRRAENRLDRALEAVRNLASTIRPPVLDDLGLEPALEAMVDEFAESSGLDIKFLRFGEARPLSPQQVICLYRVFQEALTNVARHAKATRVIARLRYLPGVVEIRVKDNGVGTGFGKLTHSRGIGLIGMQQRLADLGGNLLIKPLRRGTMLKGWLPLSERGTQ